MSIESLTVHYPYELYYFSGTEAPKALAAFRRRGTGFPVILGDRPAFERVFDNMYFNRRTPLESMLQRASELDAEQWLFERETDNYSYYRIEQASWPKHVQPMTELAAHLDPATREPHSLVVITVLPTVDPWSAPCYLRIGNWDLAPQAHEHAAMFRYWHMRYGAVPAALAHEVIEFTVEKPPLTRMEALDLARQHYVYCPDLVHFELGSLEALAARLLGASVWRFWWD